LFDGNLFISDDNSSAGLADTPPTAMPKNEPAPATRIALGILPELVGYQLRLAQIAMFRDFAQTFDELEVTPGVMGVLLVVDETPGVIQSELARAVHLDRSTVVNLLDNLERRQLVERCPSSTDRRSNAVRLTAAGSSLLRKVKRRLAQHEGRLVAGLANGELPELMALLQKVFPEHRT